MAARDVAAPQRVWPGGRGWTTDPPAHLQRIKRLSRGALPVLGAGPDRRIDDGEATFTGDGVTKVFTIAHGLAALPHHVHVANKSQLTEPRSTASATTSLITVTFTEPLRTGPHVVTWLVQREPQS